MSLTLVLAYNVLIVGASLGGGWLPGLVRLTHTRMQVLVSFVGGLMLGVGLLHMLPHAVAETGSLDGALHWAVFGLLLMFFLIRAFDFHEHAPAEVPEEAGPHASAHAEHGHEVWDGKERLSSHAPRPTPRTSRHRWIGVALGLGLHSLFDGMAVAAAVRSEATETAGFTLFGLGTFLAILLHKPLDAVSVTALMAAGGATPRWRHTVNAGFALMCPLGALLFLAGIEGLESGGHVVVGNALAFSAGVFLCISLGDLLPELRFHAHDRVKLSAALLLGVALAYAIGYVESEHAHGEQSGVRSLESVVWKTRGERGE